MTKVVVIAGWERSGSTILANVLGSAPGVVTVGEINNIWERGFGRDLLCACGQPFSRCDLWRPIANGAFGSDLATVATSARRAIAPMGNTWLIRRLLAGGRAPDDRHLPYAGLLSALYRAAADQTGAHLLVDASKSPWHARVAYDLPDAEVSVLHLLRDPRGVAHSLAKKVRYDTDDEKAIYMDRHSMTKSSLAWVYRSRLIEATWRSESRYLLMRYEDLVADPRTQLARIFDWAGLPGVGPTFTGDRIEVALSHNISGNPVRFQSGSVGLTADEEWRASLSSMQRRYIQAITWPHMRHFGYRT